MKIKEGYILKEIASSNIVVPVGQTQLSFNGIMTLNAVGTFIWKQLENNVTREQIIDAVVEEYDVDRETAEKDIDIYLAKLKEKNIIED